MRGPRRKILIETDFLVVGSGIAGLSFALDVAGPARVLILTKKQRANSNTNYARGGIAAVMGSDDDPYFHLRDTLLCGAGLCKREAVEILVREGPDRIRELLARGVPFERDDQGLSLGMEGGHSRRRIVHSKDKTGVAIETALLERAAEHPQIEILDEHFVEDLLLAESGGQRRCVGVQVIHEDTGQRSRALARFTLLASGGIGRLYRYTTNPAIATGDGVAMAYRAGAQIANMEFVQFHPTALYPPEDPALLISEAVRGEGAVIRGRDGEPFMDRYDPKGSLAPRDVVARAIHSEMKRTGDEHVVVDLSGVPRDLAETRFSATMESCRRRGIEPFRDGIPVVPAAHYGCGGIATDTWARTGVSNLLAVGEVASTGVHGANRLASNSLLEAVVFAKRASAVALDALDATERPSIGDARVPARIGRVTEEVEMQGASPSAVLGAPSEGIERLRGLMWDKAGIVRDLADLHAAEIEVSGALAAVEDRAAAAGPESVVVASETRNAYLAAWLVIRSALTRRESRGLHYLRDYRWRDNEHGLRETIVQRQDGGTE